MTKDKVLLIAARFLLIVLVLAMIALCCGCSNKTVWRNFHVSYNDWTGIVSTKEMQRTVTFTESCKYKLNEEDQGDWNKLFGYSLGVFPVVKSGKVYRPAHFNSVRFGWRYNIQTEKIEVTPYYYIDGKRFYHEINGSAIMALNLNQAYVFRISKGVFYINGEVFWKDSAIADNKLGWKLCLFMGGTWPATHKTTVRMK